MNTEQEAIESKDRLSKIEQQIEDILADRDVDTKDLIKTLDYNMFGALLEKLYQKNAQS